MTGNSPVEIQASAKAMARPTIGEKLAFGAGDVTTGMGQDLMRAPPIEDQTPFSEEMAIRERAAAGAPVVDKAAADREQNWQNRRKLSGDTGFEAARAVGSTLASLPLTAISPEFGGGIPGSVARGAMQGFLQSTVNPVTSGDYNKEKAKQGVVGTGIGAGTGLITGMAGEMISPTPNKDPKVQRFIDQGGRPTFGQSIGPKAAELEDKLSAWPGLGDLIKNSQRRSTESMNEAAYNDVLGDIGAKFQGKVGHQGVQKVGDTLSAAYEEVVPQLRLVPDEKLANDIADAGLIKARMSKAAARQFDSIVKDLLPGGTADGEALKSLQSQLTYEISRFGKSPNPSDQMIADGLDGVRSAVMDNLARNNPEVAERLMSIDKGWAKLVRLERAAANSKDGVFTTDTLLNAIKATDDSVRKRAYARGQSLMQDFATGAHDVIGARYPDSGTPGRLLTSGVALGWMSPKALAFGAGASIPYLPGVRNMALTAGPRPAWAPAAADAVKRIGPAVNGALIFGARGP
jgi:hypothetical protein